MPLRTRVGCLAVALGLAACTPTFNWRQWRQDGTPLVALMPCKPDQATRPIPLSGAPAELHMASCEAGGLTYALAWAEAGDASRAAELWAQWPRAALASVRATEAAAQPWNQGIKGVEQVKALQVAGQDAKGRATTMQAIWFARGTQVYQAAIYGPSIREDASAPFFEGLSLP